VLAGGSFEFEVVLQVCNMVSARMCGLIGASGDSLHNLQFEDLVTAVVEVAVQDLEGCMFAVSTLSQYWSCVLLEGRLTCCL
jgi:hypothetical protein